LAVGFKTNVKVDSSLRWIQRFMAGICIIYRINRPCGVCLITSWTTLSVGLGPNQLEIWINELWHFSFRRCLQRWRISSVIQYDAKIRGLFSTTERI